jgi:hypothetical protein
LVVLDVGGRLGKGWMSAVWAAECMGDDLGSGSPAADMGQITPSDPRGPVNTNGTSHEKGERGVCYGTYVLGGKNTCEIYFQKLSEMLKYDFFLCSIDY